MNTSKVPVCEWSFDDDDFWKTACGNAFVLIEGTPVENEMRFCPYCGGKLVEHIVDADDVPNAIELTGSPLAASPATGGSDVE